MCIGAMKRDAAFGYQPLGICKWHTGNTAAESSGIDTQDQVSRLVIVIKFFIECCCDRRCLFALPEWIHDTDALWQSAPEHKCTVEMNYLVGECLHSCKITPHGMIIETLFLWQN